MSRCLGPETPLVPETLGLATGQQIWSDYLTKKVSTRCSVLMLIYAFGLMVRARTETLCLGQDLQLFPHTHTNLSHWQILNPAGAALERLVTLLHFGCCKINFFSPLRTFGTYCRRFQIFQAAFVQYG
jgi:hypothetical protein